MPQVQQSTWKSQSGYVWSLIGSAVGFANILSFSAQVYKNGGGAFLIPYCFALFLVGIPFLLLEGLIGYKWKAPLVAAYGKVWGKAGKMLGWMSVLACLTIGAFYIVLTGYSAAYTYFSALDQIPEDSQTFFLHTFLKTTASLSDFGQISLPIILATLTVVGFAWFVLVRDVRDGIERVCTIFMPIMTMILAGFALIVCFLPGGMDGWVYYLKPDFTRLGDPALWRDVFGQLFFSLSLSLGIIIGYSRHTSQTTSIGKAMLWVALGDFIVSFVAGFAIIGCLAHISYVQNVPFESILTSNSTFEIGFILFPKLLKFFGPGLSQVISTVFFFCVFIAGITGVFSIVESIAGNIEVEFQTNRKKAVSFTLGAMMLFGCIFCMGNGSHIIDALVPMVMGTNMLIGGLALIIAFHFTAVEFKSDPLWSKNGRQSFYSLALRYFVPAILVIILAGNLWDELQGFDLAKGVRWSWFGVSLCIAAYLSSKAKQAKEQFAFSNAR